MMIVAVGSTNRVKVNAARLGISALVDVDDVIGVETESGVSAQPMGDEETMQGAITRARAVLAEVDHAQLGVGLEGGVITIADRMYCYAWCAIVDHHGQLGLASTGKCELPPKVKELVLSGVELGHANDQVFGRTNSKHHEGAVGILTDGRIDRTAFYVPAVTFAMVRFINKEWF